MSCCGKGRAKLLQTIQANQMLEPGKQTSLQNQSERHSPIYFQYIGKTGLTVLGRETRNRYRFDGPGAVVAVDVRDQLAMTAVPNLRQVKVH
jgi:hypothetical protein